MVPAAQPGSGGVAVVPVMQATHLWDPHDPALTGRLDRARNRRVLVEREMRARSFVVVAIELHQPLESRRAEHDDVIEHSRRTDPINRSTYAFCHGERGAVRRSSKPIAVAVSAHPSNA